MTINKKLASVTADASKIEAKLEQLFKAFPEGLPNQLFSMVSDLADNIVFVNSPVTVGADGALKVICALDLDTAAYNKVMSAARTRKINFAHDQLPY